MAVTGCDTIYDCSGLQRYCDLLQALLVVYRVIAM